MAASSSTIGDPPRPLRIAHIAPTSFFADYGCHVRILEEVLALQGLGCRVTVSTYHSGANVEGLDIRRAPGLFWHDDIQVGSSAYRLIFDVLLMARALRASIRTRPDIVHAHLHEGALVGSMLSRIWRVPLVFDYQGSLTSEMADHGFFNLSRRSLAWAPLRWLENRINHLASVVLTSSHNAANLLVSEFGYPRRRIVPLPDGVNTERFLPRWQLPAERRAQLLAELGIPAGRRLVVYLGLLAEYQGSGSLLLALARLVERHPDIHLLLMGFPGHERYREFAATLGLSDHVTIPGRIPYAEAPQYLALGEVAVSPKISETEGNGKLLNYMAVGLPTVTFDTPVSHEILGDLGTYARTGDDQSLALGIEKLLYGDPQWLAELSRRLRQRAEENFSWAAGGRQLLAVYNRLIRRTP